MLDGVLLFSFISQVFMEHCDALNTEVSPEDSMMEKKTKALMTRVLLDQPPVCLQGPVLWPHWLGSTVGHFFKHQCPSLDNCCRN